MVQISRLAIIKFLELVLVCILIGLHSHYFYVGTEVNQFLAAGTFGGYLIILVGLFAGGVMGTPVNRRVDLFFSLVGCALFVAVGALIIQRFGDSGKSEARDISLSKGSISIIEGALFLVDAILTFRGEA